jgi:hypothetical protein
MSLRTGLTVENAPKYLKKWFKEDEIRMYEALSGEDKLRMLKHVGITNYNKAIETLAAMIRTNQYKSLNLVDDPENLLDYVISGE